MRVANFCAECGAQLKGKGWRSWLRGNLCQACARRVGRNYSRSLIMVVVIAVAAFALGRYLHPAPPPLTIQRATSSPVSDAAVNSNEQSRNQVPPNTNQNSASDLVYICGASTRKGTPCHRRVHFAGERCFQHKGMAAILSPEKLIIKP